VADRYIDQDEILIYGPFAIRQIGRIVRGRLEAFDGVLDYMSNELTVQTEAVRTAVAAAREADVVRRRVHSPRVTSLSVARSALGHFSTHLDTHDPDTIDRKKFFTRDGTAGGVGKSAPRVLLTLTEIAKELDSAPEVREAAHWRTVITEARDELAQVVDHAESAAGQRRLATPEVEAARLGWLTVYQATKSQVEVVLRLIGALDWMRLVFHDLTVAPGTHVVEAPPDPPVPGVPEVPVAPEVPAAPAA
jgi:hypothetical protein